MMVAKRAKVWLAVTASACLMLGGCSNGGAAGSADVSADGVTGKLIATGPDSDWLSYGRTYDEQRYSPLADINRQNVKDMGLAWFSDLDTARGQESTPLVIDGVIYITTAWSKVKAYDAVTGKELWAYDPEVPGDSGVKGCCDVVNRGLGAWGDKLYLGTFDGRLVALDRKTGKVAWSTVTVDQSKPYTITGAPRVIDGKVIIGNGGAEMGVRGYITAYDAQTGKQLWRFYTTPDAPGKNAEKYLKDAEKTWHGQYWKQGGGGTVWDAMAYDPELDLLYIGVGNGSPWNQGIRSEGKGDNLYLSSIVAIRPKTGEYVWHFQTTPGETWDFTATQHIMLADLEIGGKVRKVLMQAPKNGFFYVIDRKTGEFISGKNFVPVNWASGLDAKGRPIENPESRYYKTGKPFIGSPGAGGAHSWHPMAWDPKEKLVYIPAQIAAFPYFPDKNWKHEAKGFNTGVDMSAGSMPADIKAREGAAKATKGELIAWDPVAQKERWRVTFPSANNGGILATGGGLVFQGNMTSEMAAYATDTGAKLWSYPVQTGVVAPPITYKIGGTQYVAVVAGWGGIWALAPGGVISQSGGPVHNISRLLVFKVGGTAKLPPAPKLEELPLDPPAYTGTPQQLSGGAYHYGRYCGTCHGDAAVGGGLLPDLRRSALIADKAAFQTVVHDGALKSSGMVGWSDVMSADEIEAIRQYVIHRANEDKALEKAGKAGGK